MLTLMNSDIDLSLNTQIPWISPEFLYKIAIFIGDITYPIGRLKIRRCGTPTAASLPVRFDMKSMVNI